MKYSPDPNKRIGVLAQIINIHVWQILIPNFNLVNDIIKDTPSQTKLSSFESNIKSSTKKTDIDKVGAKYWRGFRKRHAHLLENKKGEKFELDRSNWLTYQNFRSMYDMIEDKLVECGIAKKIDPVWMSKEGEVLESEEDINPIPPISRTFNFGINFCRDFQVSLVQSPDDFMTL